MMVVLFFLVFIVLMALGIPIAFAIGLESLILLVATGTPLNSIPQKLYTGVDSFTLIAIPGFLLAGNLMNGGGMTDRIVHFCNCLFGNMRGGLGVTNVAASMIFGGISGSAVGDTSSIGAVLIPAMKNEGYDAEFSVGITAASSCLAPIIPPSIPMIVAAACTGLSVGKLFIAGMIPGIIYGLLMIALAIYYAYARKYPRGHKVSHKELFLSSARASWAIFMMIIILYGILGGLFTPTEASIIAVIYGFFVGMFVYRELRWRDVPRLIIGSLTSSSAILMITAFATLFGWIITRSHIPTYIANGIVSLTGNKLVILLLVNLLLLFVGMFMETLSAILILFPILLKICNIIGMDQIQFTVMCVVNLVIGLCTPPIGVCLSLASQIGKISMSRGTVGVLPFLGTALVTLLLIVFVPPVTIYLPTLLFG